MFRLRTPLNLNPQALGQQTQARLLLTGRVVQRGEQLLVQGEIMDASEQKQLWGERFNGTSADIFEVEGEIATGSCRKSCS